MDDVAGIADDPTPSADESTGVIVVRYFAAAERAAGITQESRSCARTDTVQAVLARVGARDPSLAGVIARCSFLLDGVAADADREVGDARVLDVLPPFAGG